MKDICTLPAVTGECSDYTEKWYFDTAIQRCVTQFKNVFHIYKRNRHLPSQNFAFIIVYYTKIIKYSISCIVPRCRPFYYGGCGGNENRFSSQSECEGHCVVLSTTTAAPTPPQAQTGMKPDRPPPPSMP